jgi:ABC-type multidrug transport system ATPase subunit
MYPLVADCVSKTFHGRPVLTSASLRAQSGQVRAIFGRNGSGKSTLLKIAVGWIQPDSGVVRIHNAPQLGASLPKLAREGVFYLPDHDILAPTFTLAAQLALFERRYKRRSGRDAARIAQVEHLLDRRPPSFSGGELRRAEIALAIARAPAVLVADEPYRGITPADHDGLTDLFRTLASEGCAVVVTGHEVPSLLAAAHHVTWCTDGTTYELGPPEFACAHEGFRDRYLGPGSFGIARAQSEVR